MNNKDNKIKTLDIVYIAMGAALITICSWISIPFTVPFTLQTFGVFAVLVIMGGLRGLISILVYILMGLVGVPVFSGFKAGPGVLFGNTGGYILGFVIIALLYLIYEKAFAKHKNKIMEIAVLVLGLILCYVFGTLMFVMLYSKNVGAVSIQKALKWCVIPFIVPDLIKLFLALTLGKRLAPLVRNRD
ncbi:MAG: biotin transporter BioY [Lachnospiraceae bacterium]|nr:biotin transporter BioY [Lachnospiraceae bacterium]